jgi:hypothetical protein
MDLDELVEHWTLLDDEQDLVAGKRGATRLGFALVLKFHVRYGRFSRGRAWSGLQQGAEEYLRHLGLR